MNWTAQKPSFPGFYWLRGLPFPRRGCEGDTDNGYPVIVEVTNDRGRARFVGYPGDDDVRMLDEADEFNGAEWFGPIRPPA